MKPRLVGLAVAGAIALPSGAVMAGSAGQARPPAALAMAASEYQYTATTERAVRKSGKVNALGILWTCKGRACMTKGPWPVPGVSACQALAKEVGRIVAYGHPGRKLSAADLTRCNQGLGGKGGSAPAGGGGQVPPHVPVTPPIVTPPIKGLPGGSRGPALPGSGGGAGAPPAGAGDTIRGAAGNPIIDSLGSFGSCLLAGRELEIHGRRFGPSRSFEVWLGSPGRGTPVSALTVRAWSDTLIRASIPARVPIDRPYAVGLRDARDWVSNLREGVRLCPTQFPVSGNIGISNCAATASNVVVDVQMVGAGAPTPVHATPGASGVRYETRVPAGDDVRVQLTPRLIGASCPGGSWDPPTATLNLSYAHAGASQDFSYSVPEATLPFPLRGLCGLLQARFSGIQVHINNYDPATRGHRANDSYIRLPPGLGGAEQRFDIPEVRSTGRTYWVNDINLASIRVLPASPRIQLVFDFESDGVEMLGKCEDDATCVLGTPPVEADMRVDVYLSLARRDAPGALGSLSYGDVRVVATPNARASGVCRMRGPIPIPPFVLVADICDVFTNYRATIQKVTENEFTAVLDSAGLRDQVAIALKPELSRLGIGQIVSVRVEGDTVRIQYLPSR